MVSLEIGESYVFAKAGSKHLVCKIEDIVPADTLEYQIGHRYVSQFGLCPPTDLVIDVYTGQEKIDGVEVIDTAVAQVFCIPKEHLDDPDRYRCVLENEISLSLNAIFVNRLRHSVLMTRMFTSKTSDRFSFTSFGSTPRTVRYNSSGKVIGLEYSKSFFDNKDFKDLKSVYDITHADVRTLPKKVDIAELLKWKR